MSIFKHSLFKNYIPGSHDRTSHDSFEQEKFLDEKEETSSESSSSNGSTQTRILVNDSQKRNKPLSWLLKTLFVVSISLPSVLLGRFMKPSWEMQCLDSQWNVVKDNVHYGHQEFNPRFQPPLSDYMGELRPDLDERWYKLSTMYTYAIDHKTVERMNRTKGTVQFPGEDAYMVGLEAFHQLHCLNYVRMYTEQAYYEKFDFDMIAESAEERRDHKNHCVEVLRQKLMCQPDLNVYTYHWVGHHELPLANLHTPHARCIDWDAFNDWQLTETRAARHLRKPAGAEVLY